MPSDSEELDQMKLVDLRVIAAELGFEINTRRSSRGSVCMDHPSGDRILVGRATDGHYVWCAVRGRGSGSAIDLWQQHRGGSLGDVRRALRAFLGGGAPPPPHAAPGHGVLPALRPIERDILGVCARYAAFAPLGPYHPYLCGERAVPREILSDPKFAERLKIDERGNAVFPHYDGSGLCGWEARNHGFVSFSKGGRKAIWCSVPAADDHRLVIAESGIDALSYAAIAGHHGSRFLSFSGGLNNTQPSLLQNAMRRMRPGSMVVAAVDNDDAGDGYVSVLETLFNDLGRDDLAFQVDRPAVAGFDWNDTLKVGQEHPNGDDRASPVPSRLRKLQPRHDIDHTLMRE